MEYIYPPAAIMAIFFLIWLIKYPIELKEAMTLNLENDKPWINRFLFAYTWLSSIAFAITVTFLIRKLI
jgi:hypothetical protein